MRIFHELVADDFVMDNGFHSSRVAGVVVAIMTFSAPVSADENRLHPANNRIGASFGFRQDMNGTFEYSPVCNGCWEVIGRLTYWRKLLRWLEADASFGYWHDTYPEGKVHAWFAAVGVRPYLPLLRDEIEIALSIDWVLQAAEHPDVSGSWIGTGFIAGPDVRAWIDDTFAMSIGAEFSVVPSQNSIFPDNDNSQRHIDFGSYGAWVGVLAAF